MGGTGPGYFNYLADDCGVDVGVDIGFFSHWAGGGDAGAGVAAETKEGVSSVPK